MIDRHSDTWRDIAAWADNNLDADRAVLEHRDTTEKRTVELRARIDLLKELLALGIETEPRKPAKRDTFLA